MMTGVLKLLKTLDFSGRDPCRKLWARLVWKELFRLYMENSRDAIPDMDSMLIDFEYIQDFFTARRHHLNEFNGWFVWSGENGVTFLCFYDSEEELTNELQWHYNGSIVCHYTKENKKPVVHFYKHES